jgi:hypothetical protein
LEAVALAAASCFLARFSGGLCRSAGGIGVFAAALGLALTGLAFYASATVGYLLRKVRYRTALFKPHKQTLLRVLGS